MTEFDEPIVADEQHQESRDVAATFRPGETLSVQPKLTVGAADDPLEREADLVAEQVVAQLAAGRRARRSDDGPHDGADLGRIRRASSSGDRMGGLPVDAGFERAVRAKRGGGSQLSPTVSAPLESAFGADFSRVRLHTDGPSDQLARSIDARAFTVGTDIFLRADERSKVRRAESPLLAHELTHVVQQGGASRVVRRVQAPADPAKAIKAAAKAYQQHTKDRAKLLQWVNEAATSTDRRLANSANWYLDGRAKIFALTKTGDSNARVTADGQDSSTNNAYFPTGMTGSVGDILSSQATYNPHDLEDNTNVEIDDIYTNGWNVPGHVAVVNPIKQGKKKIFELLRHETQHDADHSNDKKSAAQGAGNDALYKLERYKTEYRAYSYEGSKNDKKSMTKTVDRKGYTWTQKQYAIFSHIYAAYDHTTDGWDNDLDVGGGVSFRDAVVAYVDPDSEGFNKYNSGKVDDVYKALKQCPAGTTAYESDEVQAVILAVNALGPDDATYIVKESPDMTKLINERLADISRTLVNQYLRQKAAS